MAKYKVSHAAIFSSIIGTASMDFIYARNREVINDMRKKHFMKAVYDKNGCYV